jgi:ERCC4 domain-containing protein
MPVLCTADNSTHESPEALRKHLRAWITANQPQAHVWAVNYLRQRKVDKGLVYAPSQVELRSLYCPTMPYYDHIGGYYSITRELGFLDRYKAATPSFVPLMRDTRLICDTREQRALTLPYKTTVDTLTFGDYAIAPPYDKGIRVERKSLSDFCGTLTSKKIDRKRMEGDSPCQRFERELIRAQEAAGYVVMLVEAPIEDALSFRDVPGMKYGKASATHIFKNLRDLLVKYPLHFQVLFAKDRIDAAAKLVRVFEMGEQVKQIDLQYAAERGLL